jgi:predicted lipoprotein with Yx(FWY)xxD motif
MLVPRLHGTRARSQSDRVQGVRRGRRLLLVGVGLGTMVAASFPLSTAQARPHKVVHTSKVMVKVVDVAGFGPILETKRGFPLYTDGAPPCVGICPVIWPPLLMPGKKTVPLGTTGLGTTPYGTQLQVTYQGKPVYKFYTDSRRRPPGGNGFQDFFVVTVP